MSVTKSSYVIYVPITVSNDSVVQCPLGRCLGRQAVTLGSVNNAELSTLITSRKAYPGVAGTLSITSGSGEISVNGGAWTSSSLSIAKGGYFQVRTTSSGSYDTAVAIVVDIDTYTDTFTVTTKSEEVSGFPYTFPFTLE